MSLVRRFAQFNRSICENLEERFPGFFIPSGGSKTYVPKLRTEIEPIAARGGADILEVGGVDRPLLEKGPGFRYTGLDIEHRDRCDEVYDAFLVQSVEEPIDGAFDVVFSQHLLEHVPDNRASARAIFGATRPGGRTIHYVPNRGHPYALLLRLLGNKWQRRILSAVQSHDGESTGGYPTFFNECTPGRMAAAFEAAGFEDVELVVYYSPTVYFRIFVPLHVLMLLFMHACRFLGLRYFAMGFIVSGHRRAA